MPCWGLCFSKAERHISKGFGNPTTNNCPAQRVGYNEVESMERNVFNIAAVMTTAEAEEKGMKKATNVAG